MAGSARRDGREGQKGCEHLLETLYRVIEWFMAGYGGKGGRVGRGRAGGKSGKDAGTYWRQ